MYTHGVNIGQALKSEALWFRRSQDDDDAASTYIRLAKLDKYHGAPSGMFMADEHLAGAIPSHGTEVGGGWFWVQGRCALALAEASTKPAAAHSYFTLLPSDPDVRGG